MVFPAVETLGLRAVYSLLSAGQGEDKASSGADPGGEQPERFCGGREARRACDLCETPAPTGGGLYRPSGTGAGAVRRHRPGRRESGGDCRRMRQRQAVPAAKRGGKGRPVCAGCRHDGVCGGGRFPTGEHAPGDGGAGRF